MPPEEVDYSLMGAETITMVITTSIRKQNTKYRKQKEEREGNLLLAAFCWRWSLSTGCSLLQELPPELLSCRIASGLQWCGLGLWLYSGKDGMNPQNCLSSPQKHPQPLHWMLGTTLIPCPSLSLEPLIACPPSVKASSIIWLCSPFSKTT